MQWLRIRSRFDSTKHPQTQVIFTIEAADELVLKLIEYIVEKITFIVGILLLQRWCFSGCFSTKIHQQWFRPPIHSKVALLYPILGVPDLKMLQF